MLRICLLNHVSALHLSVGNNCCENIGFDRLWLFIMFSTLAFYNYTDSLSDLVFCVTKFCMALYLYFV